MMIYDDNNDDDGDYLWFSSLSWWWWWLFMIFIIILMMMAMMMSPAKAIVMNDPNIAFATARLDQRPSVRPWIVIIIVFIQFHIISSCSLLSSFLFLLSWFHHGLDMGPSGHCDDHCVSHPFTGSLVNTPAQRISCLGWFSSGQCPIQSDIWVTQKISRTAAGSSKIFFKSDGST